MDVIWRRTDLEMSVEIGVLKTAKFTVMEDFSKSDVFLFLDNRYGRWNLPIRSVENGLVKSTFSTNELGIQSGVYNLKLVWCKNSKWDMESFIHHHDLGMHHIHDMRNEYHSHIYECHEGRESGWKRGDISVVEITNAFALTDQQAAASYTKSTVRMIWNRETATYGYDGLDAWELAVIRGATTLNEKEWISNIVELNATLQSELESMKQQIADKLEDVSDLLGEQHVILSANEYESLVRQGKVDDKVLYGIQDGEKISNLYFGKLPYIGSDNVFIVNTEYGTWELSARISANSCSASENVITLDGFASRQVTYTYSNGAISSRTESGTVYWTTLVGSIEANRSLKIPANTTGKPRNIVVTATVGTGDDKVDEKFTVVQDGVTALSITPTTTKNIGAAAENVTFNYTTTGNAGAISVEDYQHAGIVATINGTTKSGTITIPIPANSSTTNTCTWKFVIKSENCADVTVTINQEKAVPNITYYVGQKGGSNLLSPYTEEDLAAETGADLLANATPKTAKTTDVIVQNWMFYVLLPEGVEFNNIRYTSGNIESVISIDSTNLYKSTTVVNGVTYKIRAYKALPNDMNYTLTVNFE